MEGCVAGTSKAARLYFIIYYMTIVTVVLNVLVAFVLDSFKVRRYRREKEAQEDKLLKALIAKERKEGGHKSGSGSRSFAEESTLRRRRRSTLDVADMWQHLVERSIPSSHQWQLSRKTHHFDIYSALFRDEIRSEFPFLFDVAKPYIPSAVYGDDSVGSPAGGWSPGLESKGGKEE